MCKIPIKDIWKAGTDAIPAPAKLVVFTGVGDSHGNVLVLNISDRLAVWVVSAGVTVSSVVDEAVIMGE